MCGSENAGPEIRHTGYSGSFSGPGIREFASTLKTAIFWTKKTEFSISDDKKDCREEVEFRPNYQVVRKVRHGV